jgi:type V secretory pathway adhesin AidA
VVNQSLQQQEQDIFQLKQDQLNGKTLSDDDLKALEDENTMKSYLSGRSHIVRNKDTGALEIQALSPSFIDEDLFKIGAELYQVCVACHQTYWIKEE